jgi:hypothetical protein
MKNIGLAMLLLVSAPVVSFAVEAPPVNTELSEKQTLESQKANLQGLIMAYAGVIGTLPDDPSTQAVLTKRMNEVAAELAAVQERLLEIETQEIQSNTDQSVQERDQALTEAKEQAQNDWDKFLERAAEEAARIQKEWRGFQAEVSEAWRINQESFKKDLKKWLEE